MNEVIHIREIIDCRDLEIFFKTHILAVTDPGQEDIFAPWDQDTSPKKVRKTWGEGEREVKSMTQKQLSWPLITAYSKFRGLGKFNHSLSLIM